MIQYIQNWNDQDKPIVVRVLEKKLTLIILGTIVGAFTAVVGWYSDLPHNTRRMHCTSYKIDPLIHPCLLNNSSPRFHFKSSGDLVK